ncbi:MAG: S24 family peptidase [Shimia sp.]
MRGYAEEFARLVRERLKELNASGNSIEQRSGLPEGTFKTMLRNDPAEPKINKVKAVADALGLEFYIGPPRPEIIQPGDQSALEDAFRAAGIIKPIPGPGSNGLDPIALPRSWFQMAGVSENAVGLVRMTDAGMEPSMPPNAIVVLSTGPIPPRSSRPVCFDHNGTRMIRRRQDADGGIIILMADNPDFPPITLTGDAAAAFEPLGEVVWVSHDFGQRRRK